MRIYDFSEYSNVVIIGDIHGDVSSLKSEMSSIKDSIIICTGDLHIGYDTFERDVEKIACLQYTVAKNNNKLVIIRGNHDNPKYFKRRSTFINEIKELAANIYLAQDYSVVHMANHNILCIGGARSIDRNQRVKNINWWQNENVQKPAEDFYEELEKDGIKIDSIVSHSAPLFAKPLEFSDKLKHYNSYLINAYAMYDKNMKNEIYMDRLLLKGVYDKLNNKNQIKYYVYGHYHKSLNYTYGNTNMISLNKKEKYTL